MAIYRQGAIPEARNPGACGVTTAARRATRGEAKKWLDDFLAAFDTADITDDCILWPFSTNGGTGGRYPQVRIGGRTVRVTRCVFERITGRRLDQDESIRHTC